MANLNLKQARTLYAVKSREFRMKPAPVQSDLDDAKVISEKVQNSSCFGAVAAVIVAIMIVAVLL